MTYRDRSTFVVSAGRQVMSRSDLQVSHGMQVEAALRGSVAAEQHHWEVLDRVQVRLRSVAVWLQIFTRNHHWEVLDRDPELPDCDSW